MSERRDNHAPDHRGRDDGDPPDRSGSLPADSSMSYALRREKRIRRLKELVRDADYDVPADEVAARIIRDALFGAPDRDEPG